MGVWERNGRTAGDRSEEKNGKDTEGGDDSEEVFMEHPDHLGGKGQQKKSERSPYSSFGQGTTEWFTRRAETVGASQNLTVSQESTL